MAEIYGQVLAMAQGLSKPFAMIEVTFPSGTTVVLTGNSKTWQPVSSTSTENVYLVTDIGYTYTLTGTKNGTTKTITILINKAYEFYQYAIQFYPAWYETLKGLSAGNTLSVENRTWIVVNKTTSAAVLALQEAYSLVWFGGEEHVQYRGSLLAQTAQSFENGLSTETKNLLNEVTVPHDKTPYSTYDVTAKVFVPSRSQCESSDGYSYYYASRDNRVCHNDGANAPWYTSSAYMDNENVYYVDYMGILRSTSPSTQGQKWFRPHIEVNLTL